MLTDVQLSGVAFSHDQQTGLRYASVNYSEGKDTTAVTSGKSSQVWIHHHSCKTAPPASLEKVLDLLDEITSLCGHSPIDIEFAITQKNQLQKLWLLQARPLVVAEMPISSANTQKTAACQELSIVVTKIYSRRQGAIWRARLNRRKLLVFA